MWSAGDEVNGLTSGEFTPVQLGVHSSQVHIYERQRSIGRAIKGKTSAYLNVVPLEDCHFDLAPSQFRDGLAIQYQLQPSCIPIKCDGCSANFTLQRALDCKTGGLVIQ